MRRRISILMGSCLAVLLFAAIPLWAQRSDEIVAKVGFAFVAGDQTLPAGTYRVSRPGGDIGGVTIAQTDGSAKAVVPVVTRLARGSGGIAAKKATIVFDRVGEKSYVSEIWLEGQDGLLVRSTSEEHKHVVVSMGS